MTRDAVERLAGKRVFFGHHSVGFNIVEGLREVAEEAAPGRLRIVESRDPAALDAPAFAHARVGRNEYPGTKIEAFVEALEAGLGDRAEIAFFKLCFVDVTAGTDAAELFDAYRRAMAQVRRRFARLAVVHVTVPLTTVERGWKAAAKRLLGRAPDRFLDNLRRGEYNSLLRREYAGREPVYDLAATEATAPSGRVARIRFRGRAGEAMAPEWARDRGHLNAAGRRRAALGLVEVLGGL